MGQARDMKRSKIVVESNQNYYSKYLTEANKIKIFQSDNLYISIAF